MIPWGEEEVGSPIKWKDGQPVPAGWGHWWGAWPLRCSFKDRKWGTA